MRQNAAVSRRPNDAKALHGRKALPVLDDVFFTKEQVRIGTMMLCMGRLDTNSLWEVVEIVSDFRTQSGPGTRKRKLKQVRHLMDEVYLKRANGTERRSITFSGLSYSAIWRLYTE